MLHNVPAEADKGEIERSIWSEADKPRHIELAPVPEPYYAGSVPSLVESLLTRIGPVDFKMDPRDHDKRFQAVAQFVDESDAREAVRTLHDQRHDFLKQGKLFLELMSSSKFKVPARVYDCVKQDLDVYAIEWQKHHFAFRKYPDLDPEKRFVSLKVEGGQIKEVVDATNVIDGILSGKTVRAGNAPFWTPALASNGSAFQRLKQIQQQLGVVVVRNRPKRQLQFFGAPTVYPQFQELIEKRIGAQASSVHVVILSDSEFVWACRGGFAQIASALGDNIASFDVVSKPERIVVTGFEILYRQAIELVKRAQDQTPSKVYESKDQDCAICWTSVDSPVTLDCQHLCCLECLDSLCTLADSSGTDFLICCQGDMGACNKVLSLRELQNHLPSATVEEWLEASFASYVRRRPQQFRSCPTPDCGYIYHTSENARSHTCMKCSEVTCTACHQQHNRMGCADDKDLASRGYDAFEKYKREMRIKDCPRCQTALEKTAGCNHMTCGGCATHICWVCPATFPESGLCYKHTNEVHGGIGLG